MINQQKKRKNYMIKNKELHKIKVLKNKVKIITNKINIKYKQAVHNIEKKTEKNF